MLVKDIVKDNLEIYKGKSFIESPIVSIILPTYSRAKSGSLNRALDSILGQTFNDFELIIVDDASVDGTFDICMEYMSRDNRIKVLRHKKNVGLPTISTYEAYVEARGLYISFGFDDNTWEKNALEKTYDYYQKYDIKAGYGITKIKDPKTGEFAYLGQNSQYVDDNIFFGNTIGEGSVLLHREVIEEIGLFDPHISLTRICDWDLWRRLVNKYDFVATGIEFATEYGTTMSDSLGNTRAYYRWLCDEYLQSRKNLDFLKPQNYENADVFGCLQYGATPYYNQKMNEVSEYYKDKFWYQSSSFSSSENNENKKRVLVLTFGGISASLMSFTEYDGDDYVFRYMNYVSVDYATLLLTDIVVVVRGMPDDNLVAKICKNLNIPIYYYADDNFREIFKEKKETCEYKNTNLEYLSVFEGVILSTDSLIEYFRENFLHDNLILLPPTLTKKVAANYKKNPNFTIGYMGGAFREDPLLHFVIPAVLKLAEKYDITLVLPNDKVLMDSLGNLDSIDIKWYCRRLNYIRALESINSFGIDLLVHPGTQNDNNIYKTKNCLANAVLMGANLLTSNVEPYNIYDDLSEGYGVAENTVADWKKCIEQFIVDKDYSERLLRESTKAVKYIYSTEIGWKHLNEEWAGLTLEKNYLDISEKLLNDCNKLLGNAPLLISYSRVGRRIFPDAITYQPIISSRKYRFTPATDMFSNIVLAFALDIECKGDASISIRKLNNDVVATTNITTDKMVRDGLTVCKLNKLVETRGEDLIIEINAHYHTSSGRFGVFEIIPQRTFMYKCFNKLGRPLKGRNVIWIDVE